MRPPAHVRHSTRRARIVEQKLQALRRKWPEFDKIPLNEPDYWYGIKLIKQLTIIAWEKNGYAQVVLGYFYFNATSKTLRTLLKSIIWLTKASKQGSMTAFYHLAKAYKYLEGVIHEEPYQKLRATLAMDSKWSFPLTAADCAKTSLNMLTKSAKMGHNPALRDLGNMYVDGAGVTKNIKYGIFLINAAKAKGISSSPNAKLSDADCAQILCSFRIP